MFSSPVKTLIGVGIIATLFTGCATKTLITKDNKTYTRSNKVTLVEDQVVAFGKPSQALTTLPANSLVIAGQKNSYILTQGSAQFVTLITKLEPKNIQMTKTLDFYSEKNDGHFTGTLPLSYIKLKEDISKKDLEFFIENGAKECSTVSDERMLAQRFCFDIPLAGVVYPAANNLNSLKPLSKPYQVSIYSYQEESYQSKSSLNPFEKLVLLPFAVAIDVISLPFQAAEKIFD
ncbi:YidX family protein [Acinetobacter zhairhuonensis]|uniref:hypothetical protein n=1 Tax=Acinetobacter sp. A7.4 TaxID=2919921 RepID=UPI001F50351B|nr:hypothetical protein [Acinetobacter sp. A7.4]MCJ8162833.1 hypothetical protein [Acinetobacter sp. A7.4]